MSGIYLTTLCLALLCFGFALLGFGLAWLTAAADRERRRLSPVRLLPNMQALHLWSHLLHELVHTLRPVRRLLGLAATTTTSMLVRLFVFFRGLLFWGESDRPAYVLYNN